MNKLYRFSLSLLLTALLLWLAPWAAWAQSVGIGTTLPDPSAALDITSTDKGLLLPRLTLAQRTAIISPAGGLVIFQTDNTPGLYAYDGTSWVRLGGDDLGSHSATQNLNLSGYALTGTGASISSVGLGVRTDGGLNIGQNTRGNNVYLGYQAGQAGEAGGTRSQGTKNTFSGYQSGYSTTIGDDNTFGGYTSGYSNTRGARNTFYGGRSGYYTTTGNENVYLGYQTGFNSQGNQNVLVGVYSGFNNASNFNTFIGYASGYDNKNGLSNVFIGGNSGHDNITGSRNTVLGYNSGFNEDHANLTNATALGANVTLTQSNTVILGSGANVGIGTSEPATKLDVQGNLRLAVRLCPVNQGSGTTYALTNADIAYSIFKLQNGSYAPALQLPTAVAGQVEGQELTIMSVADFGTNVSGTNTDAGSVALAGINATGGVHTVKYVWLVAASGTGYWMRVQ